VWCAAVAFDVGGNAEMIGPLDCGAVLPPGSSAGVYVDTIHEVRGRFADPTERAALHARAVKHFGADAVSRWMSAIERP